MSEIRFRHSAFGVLVGWVIFLPAFLMDAQATVSWTGTTGNWNDGVNWSSNPNPPGPSDDVVIGKAAAQVILTNSTSINSLIVSNTAQLVFSNWNTTLTVMDMTIKTNGTVTLPAAFTDVAMSNRVCILCSNFMVEAGGKINVKGLGYAGGPQWTGAGTGDGYGPGKGLANTNGGSYAGGGGHGGLGPRYVQGLVSSQPYGSESMPVEPGSGGGGGYNTAADIGGAGGGAIFINASNTVCINGTLVADGNNRPYSFGAGGSGGSIYIHCLTFASTNGSITADGGQGYSSSVGDGGRIAIVSDPVAQSNAPRPVVVISARYHFLSDASAYLIRPYFGTIFVTNNFVIPVVLSGSGRLRGLSASSLPSLTVSNAYLVLDQEAGVNLSVDQDLTVKSVTGVSGSLAGRLDIGCLSNQNFSTVACGRLVLTNDAITANSASLYMYAGLGVTTNAAFTNYGALVTVKDSVHITSNAWFYPFSHPTNGGSVLFRVRDVSVDVGGGINAAGNGFMGGPYGANRGDGYGSGGGKMAASTGSAGGGGYGGNGGAGAQGAGGTTYGSSNAPVDPGSGGGGAYYAPGSSAGGGLIRMESSGTVTVDGILTANGIDITSEQSGPGSGGGIYIRCKRFAGAATGVITANGGAAYSGNNAGSGGGGRVAIWSYRNDYLGAYPAVTNGVKSPTGLSGAVGTVVIGKLPTPGTVISVF